MDNSSTEGILADISTQTRRLQTSSQVSNSSFELVGGTGTSSQVSPNLLKYTLGPPTIAAPKAPAIQQQQFDPWQGQEFQPPPRWPQNDNVWANYHPTTENSRSQYPTQQHVPF